MRTEDAVESSSLAPRLVGTGLVLITLYLLSDALTTLAVVAALIVIIFLHELGHFVTARWSGMKVTDFFLGFGPTLWSFRRDGVRYGVKAIPAGAFVRIIGMNNLDPLDDPADEPYTFRQQSYPKRMLVAGAGSAVHFILAIGLIFVLFAGFGTVDQSIFRVGQVGVGADPDTGEVTDAADLTPAERAGFVEGDEIVAVDGQPVETWFDLREILRDSPGETLTFEVVRDGQPVTLDATLDSIETEDGENVGFLGVQADFPLQRLGVGEAAVESVQFFGEVAWGSTRALGAFFSPANLGDYVSGLFESGETPDEGETEAAPAAEGENRLLSPVGFVRVAGQAADTGIVPVLELLILINIFVGIFNLVPLLPFDGGHMAVATYERLRSRRGERYHADMAKLLPLTYGVVGVLIFMGLSALYLDISDPLGNPFQP